MPVILSDLPYNAIVASFLYMVLCLLVRYLAPQCEHNIEATNPENLVTNTTSNCGLEDVDNTMLVFATDFFIATLILGLALHLSFTTNRWIMAALSFSTMGLGFIFKGLAARILGNNVIDDGKGLQGFFFLSLFQYLLWTVSTVFTGILVHAAWEMTGEESRICGSLESKIAASLNILSALVIITGCLWNGMARWNLTEPVLDEYYSIDPNETSIPVELFRIGQLAWHGSNCLFLVATAYVMGALAKQKTKAREFSIHGSATGLLMAQVALATFVIYYSLEKGSGSVKGWAGSGGYTIASTLTNYFLMMSAVFLHDLVFALFASSDDRNKVDSSAFGKSAMLAIEGDTDDFDTSDDSSGSAFEATLHGRAVNDLHKHPLSPDERASTWLFHIFPIFMRDPYSNMKDDRSGVEEDGLFGPGGSKIVIRTISSLSARSQSAPQRCCNDKSSTRIDAQSDAVRYFKGSERESKAEGAASAMENLQISSRMEELSLEDSLPMNKSFEASLCYQADNFSGVEVPLGDEEVMDVPRGQEETTKPRLFTMFRGSKVKRSCSFARSFGADEDDSVILNQNPAGHHSDSILEFEVDLIEDCMAVREREQHSASISEVTKKDTIDIDEEMPTSVDKVKSQESCVDNKTTVVRIDELDPSLVTSKTFNESVIKSESKGLLKRLRNKSKATQGEDIRGSFSNLGHVRTTVSEVPTDASNTQESCGNNHTTVFRIDELDPSLAMSKTLKESVTNSETDGWLKRLRSKNKEAQGKGIHGRLPNQENEYNSISNLPLHFFGEQDTFRERNSFGTAQPDDSLEIEGFVPEAGAEYEMTNEESPTIVGRVTMEDNLKLEEKQTDLESYATAIGRSESDFLSEYSRSGSSVGIEIASRMEEVQESFSESLLYVLNPFKKDDELLSKGSSSQSSDSRFGIEADFVESFQSSKCSTEEELGCASGEWFNSFSN
ncbi:hypothetical protein IV203_035294 [Nitzschia inconspicua]|uniref:Uncharacterized protein n=1 Tax=Nitzschia inconspicua TaxID=303405 RepID=A0A9K3LE49_9STRA|nr:hypothetical protein IV203_035294 [Nitzschia inconspicua]